MTISTKIQPIDRDLIIRLTGAPQERSAMFARFAREKLVQAEEQDRSVLGRVPPHKTFVDGKEGASEDSVRPDGGVIIYEFELISEALIWIGEQLVANSPVGSGRDPHPGQYKSSHTLFADGREIPLGQEAPVADEYVFLNALPYAAKIERGLSPQFPDGVYQSVAALASSRYDNSARITFAYRAPLGGNLVGGRFGNRSENRVPAIIVKPR